MAFSRFYDKFTDKLKYLYAIKAASEAIDEYKRQEDDLKSSGNAHQEPNIEYICMK